MASTPRTLGPPLPTPSPTPWMQASAPASPASSSLPLCLRQVVSLLVPLFQVEVPILLSGPSGPPQHGCRSGLGAVAQHGQRESVISCFHDVVRSEARQCSACQCSACWHQRSHVLLLPVASTAGYAFPDLGGITHQTLGGPSPLWTATGRSRRVQCEWRSAGTSSPSGSLQATASRSPRTSTCVTSLALLRLPPHTRTVASRMGIPSSLCVLHTQVPIGACTQGLGRVRSRRRVLRPVRGHRVRDPEPGPQVHDCWP